MKGQPIAVLAFALAAVCVVGAIILTAMSKSVPTDLWTLAFASVAGGAGIAVPTGSSSSGGTVPGA